MFDARLKRRFAEDFRSESLDPRVRILPGFAFQSRLDARFFQEPLRLPVELRRYLGQ